MLISISCYMSFSLREGKRQIWSMGFFWSVISLILVYRHQRKFIQYKLYVTHHKKTVLTWTWWCIFIFLIDIGKYNHFVVCEVNSKETRRKEARSDTWSWIFLLGNYPMYYGITHGNVNKIWTVKNTHWTNVVHLYYLTYRWTARGLNSRSVKITLNASVGWRRKVPLVCQHIFRIHSVFIYKCEDENVRNKRGTI